MEPIRNILRHKKATAKYYEAEATKIDYEKKIVYINDDSPIKGDISSTEVPFDMLVVGVGAENATFGIPGVREHSLFLKEVPDATSVSFVSAVTYSLACQAMPKCVKRKIGSILGGAQRLSHLTCHLV